MVGYLFDYKKSDSDASKIDGFGSDSQISAPSLSQICCNRSQQSNMLVNVYYSTINCICIIQDVMRPNIM